MKKEEGTGFTPWQKADCSSALSLERCGMIPTTHQQGLQEGQRAAEREKLQPTLPWAAEWEQGRRCEGLQPLAARSSPGPKHDRTCLTWVLEGFQSHLEEEEEEHPLTSELLIN